MIQIAQVYLDDIAGRGQNIVLLYHSPTHRGGGGRFGRELDCGWWDRETGNQVAVKTMWRLKQLLNLLVGQVSDILLHDEHNLVHLKASSVVIALEKLNINVGKRRTLWIRTERRNRILYMILFIYLLSTIGSRLRFIHCLLQIGLHTPNSC